MQKITFKGTAVQLIGQFPYQGDSLKNFKLVDKELKNRILSEFSGKKKVISTVPSLDTGTCNTTTKQLNELAKKHPEVVFLTVSSDLPFAQNRFCTSENVSNIITLSMMRDKEFGKHYGLLISEGPLEGILARSIIFVDEESKVLYSELVSEITKSPNFQKLQEFLNQ